MAGSELSAGEALVANGGQIIRIEDERMSSVAVLRPRDEKKVYAGALAELEAHPELAGEMYYSIPYKDHTNDPTTGCTKRADDKCPVASRVEGIGIDGSQSLLRRWGNATAAARMVGDDDDNVHLEGVFIDLEHNTRVVRPFRVSKVKRYRDGNVYNLGEDKLAMAVGAGVSKVIRNAILSGIPGPIKRAYLEKAQELAASTSAVSIPKMLEAFSAYHVDRSMLEKYFGAKLEGLPGQSLAKLKGLFVSLRDGWTTVEQVFNPKADPGGDTSPEEPSTRNVDEVLAAGAVEGSRGAPSPTAPDSAPATRGEAEGAEDVVAPSADTASPTTAEPEPERPRETGFDDTEEPPHPGEGAEPQEAWKF